MAAKRKLTPSEILNNLSEALYEAAAENEKTINDELSRSGYEPKELKAQGREFIRKMKGFVRLAKAQRSKKQLLEFVDKIKNTRSSMSEPKMQIGAWFKEQFGHEMSTSALQAFYRKLDAIDNEDVESLLHDAEFLQMWEDLDTENKEGKNTL